MCVVLTVDYTSNAARGGNSPKRKQTRMLAQRAKLEPPSIFVNRSLTIRYAFHIFADTVKIAL
jgi:hypothetical protein